MATAPARRIGKTERALIDRASTWLATFAADTRFPDELRTLAAHAAKAGDDITVGLRGVANLALALSDLQAQAKATEEETRRLLLQLIEESGIPSVLLEHHTVSVVSPDPKLVVTDPKKVPKVVTVQGREIPLWTTPKTPDPKVDLDAVGVALAAGAQIEGVTRQNGTPYVRFASSKAKAPKGRAAA